ncbi:MAG: ribosylpyrimidine nucleosidase [Sulfobacillus acidophilus]|uniref:Ribosylpyrimidine nucleosidase n=1 Tax=Sulfobacillus acidophilus TaxID=53633 RepID=A0A2T2WGU2_9FIRM|nr:MAG: ribosylpyrimidine nucleosidase [Sulfobacillus acidophilus]
MWAGGHPAYLDMDPGQDDVWALATALGVLQVLGVTTVAGNHTVDNTYRNAVNVLDVFGRNDIPVHRGCAAPLWHPLVTAPEIHGQTGLDGYAFPTREVTVADVHAVEWLASQLCSLSRSVSVIATGPLTNVAALLIGHPSVKPHLSGITVMGGSLSGGNVTPHAEFNFYVDPDAADWVMGSGVPIKMVGLDVTRQATVTRAEVEERLGSSSREAARMLVALFRFYARRHPDPHHPFPLHDVLAVAADVKPDLFEWRSIPLTVVRCDPVRRGQSAMIEEATDRQPVDVAVQIDVLRFFDWFWEALRLSGL